MSFPYQFQLLLTCSSNFNSFATSSEKPLMPSPFKIVNLPLVHCTIYLQMHAFSYSVSFLFQLGYNSIF